MPKKNAYDQEGDYKRQRTAAAQEVATWIQRDARVLEIFRDRIRFAARFWDEFDRECKKKARVVKKTGLPWLHAKWVDGEFRITSWPDRGETLQAYYAFLTAIHDEDLQAVTMISQDIWSELLRKSVHLFFWTYRGDKTDLIQSAVNAVRQDLNGKLQTPERHQILASELPRQAVKKGGRKHAHDVAFWKRVRDTYEEALATGIGSKGAWSKAADVHGLTIKPDSVRRECERGSRRKRNSGHN